MDSDQLFRIRHSLSHVLAMAVLEVFPDAKLAIGPPIENGFYYDFDLPRSIQPDDLPDLEKRMLKIIAQDLQFTSAPRTIEEAQELLKAQPYKLELVKDLAEQGEKAVSFYTSGNFQDLCKGLHVGRTSEIPVGSFSLSHAAGAYWRGSEKNPMLQRIYGLAFESKVALEEYLHQQEEAKKRDHRLLGPQLGIFMHSEDVGAGLPLWMPNGETIKYLLQEYMREKEQSLGYQYVSTPVIAHETLYQRSGHAEFYKDDMYKFQDKEGTTFYLSPMNCPHHHMIYERMTQSYRDLPLKLAEGKGLYRNELSGTLTGLIRVRGAITQNDSHIYVTPAQLKEEFTKVLELFKEVYAEVGVQGYWFRLSLPDRDTNPHKYAGDPALWDYASDIIRETLEEFGSPFVEAIGEAAFYGPKLDVQIKNVTGKEDSIATSQVDILVPQRMGLTYIDEQGQEKTPLIIHRAILGSYERFTAFLIEQTAGNFPFWLAPIQVAVLSVSDQFNQAALELAAAFSKDGLRVSTDLTTESVGKKIRAASLQKIPAKIVIGSQELESKNKEGEWKLKVNWRTDLERLEDEKPQAIENILESMQTLVKDKARS